jgi:hypothetical protein
MHKTRRPFIPLILSAVLTAFLLFAATAAAETQIGEGTSPEQPALPGEGDLLKASLEYDSITGSATVALTTRQAQESIPEAKRPEIQYLAVLLNVNFPCSREGFEAAAKQAGEGQKGLVAYPVYELFSANEPITEPPPGQPVAQAYGAFVASEKEMENGIEAGNFAAGTKVVSGTTATMSTTSAKAANLHFNCAEVVAQNLGLGGESDVLLLPLTTKPEPPPVQNPTPAPTSPPAPAATPPAAVFSIGKAKKPPKLKVGKWTTVKVKVTNIGGTATAPGSLQLKATKGVVVKSGRQKLPVLLPGGTWTVSYKVEMTEKAKATSTLSLIATGGGLTGKGSLVVKRKD